MAPFMHELLVRTLVRASRFYELHQFLQYHVVADSVPLACQLLSLAAVYAPASQLGLDMLLRLERDRRPHTDALVVEALVAAGDVIRALRYVASRGLFGADVVPAARLLAAAAARLDRQPTALYTVWTFFASRAELTAEQRRAWSDRVAAEYGDEAVR